MNVKLRMIAGVQQSQLLHTFRTLAGSMACDVQKLSKAFNCKPGGKALVICGNIGLGAAASKAANHAALRQLVG
jgi:hypothetical protein